jgi:VWFA-related protein
MRFASRCFLPFCLLLAGLTWLNAQKPAAEPASGPTFRSRADLVMVPVQVRRHGDHVPGLSKDAFTVLQDGQEQKITVFDEIRTTTERLKRVPVGPDEFSNQLQGNPEAARYTVIAIDKVNTTTMDMNRLRMGLMKFLASAADSGDPIRLVAINLNNIEIIQDFTTNPKVLAEALKRVDTAAGKPRPGDPAFTDDQKAMTVGFNAEAEDMASDDAAADRAAHMLKGLDNQLAMQQQQIQFRDRSSRISALEALQQIAISLTGYPGRKSVVWASSGYPFSGMITSAFGSVNYTFNNVIEATMLDEYTTHLLNTANIALYPVDARGTQNTAFAVMDPSLKNSPTSAEKEAAQQGNQDVITTFEHLAAATGGIPCYERTDLSGCFKDALEDAREYYLVGYYINREKLKPGWHKINVKVSEKGTSVRSRNGFLLPKFSIEQVRAVDMRTELSSRFLDPGIPFVGRWGTPAAKADKKSVPLQLQIAGSSGVIAADQPHLNLEIAAVARKIDGTVAAQFSQKVDRQLPAEAIAVIQQAGISYKNALDLPSGEYMVRVVVRDNNTGRLGSISTLLKVE